MIKYSILTTHSRIIKNKNDIISYLEDGKKVILITDKDTKHRYLQDIESRIYLKNRLLQIFEVNQKIPEITIRDGKMNKNEKSSLEFISNAVEEFNYQQYIIEHAHPDENIMVEAGAGTGKTTVMIDRIMFLIHTVNDLSFEDIAMITFTNKAAYSMKEKINSELLKRYKLTRLPKYLKLIEDTSKFKIQTIHSFSNDMIAEFGSSLGYSREVSIRGLKYQKEQIIYDVLNDIYDESGKSVEAELGGRIFELAKTLGDFLAKLENMGLTDKEIKDIDWGQAKDHKSQKLHNTLKKSLIEISKRYNQLKFEEDSISVDDIVRELRKIVENIDEVVLSSSPIKYLFVDEFQDSDNSQIKTISILQKYSKLKLFVVGDIKQSIYRFRGAEDKAFEMLDSLVKENIGEKMHDYTLTKNYRTSEDILNKLDYIFEKWAKKELLDYNESLVPQKDIKGYPNFHKVRNNKNNIKNKTIEITKNAYEDIQKNQKKDKNIVAVLTRTNEESRRISNWYSEAGIPTYNRQEGSLFSSIAVLEFQTMIRAYLYPMSSINLYNYINTSYILDNIEIEKLSKKKSESREQIKLLEETLKRHNWIENKRLFRLKPVISVLREIVEKHKPVKKFISKRKKELAEQGWKNLDINRQVSMEANQYEANLEKIFEVLRKNFTGEMASLKNIHDYLKINIATNREEDEADIGDSVGSDYIHCMTVHKSKGLEFDTVIIPLTDRCFRWKNQTEILIEEKDELIKVGWNKVFDNRNNSFMSNNYYEKLLGKEVQYVKREEIRLLYVALTRSIRRLEIITIGKKKLTWSNFLEG